MFKKAISLTVILSSLIVLPGCGSDEETTTEIDSQNFNTYQSNEISISVPKEWDIIESKDFSSKVPQNTLLVLRNNVKNDLFTANVNIVVSKNEGKSSLDNAKEIFRSESEGLISYNGVSRENLNLQNNGSEDETEFIIFEGKNNEEEDVVRYSQTVLSSEEKVYVVTGSYKLNEDEKTVNLVQGSVKSFQIK